jgi:acyl carrier protein
MTHDEILQAVREVVTASLRRPVSDTQALVSSGLIDSLMILRLISEIEKKLNVRIQTATIQPDDFDTLELAAETVERTAAVE